MKNIIFITFLLACKTILAQTNIPGGDVSGTWYMAGSPYIIHGNVTIPTDSTLTIEPGVEVLFDGYYRLDVRGILDANGTASDSVYFMPTDTLVGWRGIYYTLPGTQQLSYCVIKYSFESGIWIQANFFNLQVRLCTIAHCRSEFGGGIYAHGFGSTLQISHSTIAYNTAESNSGGKGGGIYLFYGTLNMDSCIVHGNRAVIPSEDINHAVQGGGIYIGLDAGAVVISGSFITDNFIGLSNGGEAIGVYPPDRGGGIYNGTYNPVTISHCEISGNRANIDYRSGGGIFTDNMSTLTTLSYCNISNNWSREGAGGYEATGNSNIVKCTFLGNSGRAITFHLTYSATVLNVLNTIIAYNEYGIDKYGSGTVTVKYSNIIDNCYNMPSGFGVLDTVNFNGDPCDVYFNIFMDPLFADPANGDYRLTWANWPTPDSTKSPCIDAGDPSSALDPDNTITDMGVFYFNQLRPIIMVSNNLLDFGVVNISQSQDLPLKIYNTGTANLCLQGMTNLYSVYTHNWNPTDSLILPGDSLNLTVTFAPVDTTLIVDTLLIENNDMLLQIQLSGKGNIMAGIEEPNELPKVYVLYPAYPNPFNPNTSINFDLPKNSQVTLKIFNILGEQVTTLVSKQMPAGTYSYEWDGSNVASGIYLYRLEAEGFVETRKMVLMK